MDMSDQSGIENCDEEEEDMSEIFDDNMLEEDEQK